GVAESETADIYCDAYDVIAQHAISRLMMSNDPASQYWLEHRGRLRDLLKKPVMVLPYGASHRTMRKEIWKGAAELNLKPSKDAVERLLSYQWEGIKTKLPGALLVQKHIKRMVLHLLEPGREPGRSEKGRRLNRFRSPPARFLSWITPSGFPVLNRHLEVDTHQ